MILFPLQIVTSNGLVYDQEVYMVQIRTTEGDIGVRANHVNYVAALGMGRCRVNIDKDTLRDGACIGGLIVVKDGAVSIVATTFEWADEIDIPRALIAQEMATEILATSEDEHEKQIAQSRLNRALVRLGVSDALEDE